MRFTRFSTVVCITLVAVFALAQSGLAVPRLQLDIVGGTYDEASETIIAPAGDVIELIALFTPNGNPSEAEIAAMLEGTFYLSAALIGAGGEEAGSLGSFDIGESTVIVPDDMVFGVPPVEQLGGDPEHDAHDLSQHDIFETYFYELAFHFATGNTTETYNSQNNPGGLLPSENGETFYQTFTVDMSNLAAGAQLHFDLYTTNFNGNGPQLLRGPSNGDDVDRVLFAPFSHDAETNRLMPEPTTLWLLAAGFLGASLIRRRRRR